MVIFEADAFLRRTKLGGPERCHIRLDESRHLTLAPVAGDAIELRPSGPIHRTALSLGTAVLLLGDGNQVLIDFFGSTWWMDPGFHKTFSIGRFRLAEFNAARRSAQEFKRHLLGTAP